MPYSIFTGLAAVVHWCTIFCKETTTTATTSIVVVVVVAVVLVLFYRPEP